MSLLPPYTQILPTGRETVSWCFVRDLSTLVEKETGTLEATGRRSLENLFCMCHQATLLGLGMCYFTWAP